MTLLAEKRKVGSSTLPLTTIGQPGRQPASPAFSLLRGCFRLYFSSSAGICRGVPSCPWGPCVGTGRDADLWDFCGATPRLRWRLEDLVGACQRTTMPAML
jgi:hypothetical protein